MWLPKRLEGRIFEPLYILLATQYRTMKYADKLPVEWVEALKEVETHETVIANGKVLLNSIGVRAPYTKREFEVTIPELGKCVVKSTSTQLATVYKDGKVLEYPLIPRFSHDLSKYRCYTEIDTITAHGEDEHSIICNFIQPGVGTVRHSIIGVLGPDAEMPIRVYHPRNIPANR